MSLRFSMYGTSPSKKVRRSCASSCGAVAGDGTGTAVSTGAAPAGGGAEDAEVGTTGPVGGVCAAAKHDTQTQAANSSETRRFSMAFSRREGWIGCDV